MTREDDPLGAKCDSLGMQREMRSGVWLSGSRSGEKDRRNSGSELVC
jgi:hypothetical protein